MALKGNNKYHNNENRTSLKICLTFSFMFLVIMLIFIVMYSSMAPEEVECPTTNHKKGFPLADGTIELIEGKGSKKDNKLLSSLNVDLSWKQLNEFLRPRSPFPSYFHRCNTKTSDLVGIPVEALYSLSSNRNNHRQRNNNNNNKGESAGDSIIKMIKNYDKNIRREDDDVDDDDFALCKSIKINVRNISNIAHSHPGDPIFSDEDINNNHHRRRNNNTHLSTTPLPSTATTKAEVADYYEYRVNQLFVHFGSLIKFDISRTIQSNRKEDRVFVDSSFSSGSGDDGVDNDDNNNHNHNRKESYEFYRDKTLKNKIPGQVINFATPLVDASFLYGSTEEEQSRLRSFTDGFLRVSYGNSEQCAEIFEQFEVTTAMETTAVEIETTTTTTTKNDTNPGQQQQQVTDYKIFRRDVYDDDDDNHDGRFRFEAHRLCSFPPRNETDGTFICGDPRCNDNLMVLSIYTILMREHNFWARVEKLSHSEILSDEELFQRARRRVRAEFNHIVYHSWLPILLGDDYFARSDSGKTKCFATNPKKDPRTYIETPVALNLDTMVSDSVYLRHWEYPYNIIDSKSAKWMYSIHHPHHDQQQQPQPQPQQEQQQQQQQQRPSDFLTNEHHALESILSGLVRQRSENYDLFVVDSLRDPSGTGVDRVSRELIRSRDHAVPPYAEVYWQLHKNILTQWEQISKSPQVIERLKRAYGSRGLNRIDLWTGLVAEDHPPGSMVGETTKKLLINQFSDLRDSDWFFYLWDSSVQPWLSSVFATGFSQIIERNTRNFQVRSSEDHQCDCASISHRLVKKTHLRDIFHSSKNVQRTPIILGSDCHASVFYESCQIKDNRLHKMN